MDKLYDHKTIEKEMQELWAKLDSYRFDEKSNKEIYSIDTPPPTVSGSLHIGHICSYTQTDLLARFKRMRGYNVFYPMGFDDNGLPTERFVEKKHKTRGHLMKRSEFVDLCLRESKEMAEIFSALWRSIGLSIDWNHVYSTISDRSRRISQLSFIELYKKNLVYKKEEPALYCTTCCTTVAQAELDDAQVASTFNNIVFTTSDGEELIVATTRPELLPACVALFYNPNDERYTHLKGKKAKTPIFGQEVQILSDELVSLEKGTGLVMCCTFGDQTDVVWYKKHKLPFVQVIGRDGKWTAVAGALSGLRVRDARKKVLELLSEAGLLREQKAITHNVNVHERCKQDIEYLILNQWFVKVLDHKDKFLEFADQINWKPSFMKARYKDWVENLGWDWCISRQRFYGVPFPVWYCAECRELLLADESFLPIDPQEQAYPGGVCPKCSSSHIVPESDIMDTWNTSSLTPQINSNWPESGRLKLPMSLRPQAHDIIRTWTFYTIVKAFYHNNMIPWRDIAISGYVVSSGREKISKSQGNSPVDPENLLKNYPADSIRYWAANGRLGVDTQFSENQFKIGTRLLTKLWNAFRFCKEHIELYEKSDSEVELDDLNKWILHHLSNTTKEYIRHFEAYDYTFALESAEKFFWHLFCDNYLELVKDRVFNPDKYSAAVIAGTQYTLYQCGLGILQLFAPFVPHVTEKLYQQFFLHKEGIASLHTTIIDEKRFSFVFEGAAESIDLVVDLVGQVRKLKSENQLSLKVELSCLEVKAVTGVIDKLRLQESIIKGITQAQKIAFTESGDGKSELQAKGEAWQAVVFVNLAKSFE